MKDRDPWSVKQHHWKSEETEDHQLSPSRIIIMLTCPCNGNSLTSHFYVENLLLNIDCGYSLETVHCVTTIYVLSKNTKNITICHLKIIDFTAVKNWSIQTLRCQYALVHYVGDFCRIYFSESPFNSMTLVSTLSVGRFGVTTF